MCGQVVEQAGTTGLLTNPIHEYTRGLLGGPFDRVGPGRLHQVPVRFPARASSSTETGSPVRRTRPSVCTAEASARARHGHYYAPTTSWSPFSRRGELMSTQLSSCVTSTSSTRHARRPVRRTGYTPSTVWPVRQQGRNRRDRRRVRLWQVHHRQGDGRAPAGHPGEVLYFSRAVSWAAGRKLGRACPWSSDPAIALPTHDRPGHAPGPVQGAWNSSAESQLARVKELLDLVGLRSRRWTFCPGRSRVASSSASPSPALWH